MERFFKVNASGTLRGVGGVDGKLGCMSGKKGTSHVCVCEMVMMAPPIHLGAWSMLLLPLDFVIPANASATCSSR